MTVRRHQEAGTTLILVASTMFLLMGMAAIALDVGAAMNERRQDQSASDVASLAAVQFARPSSGSTSVDDAMANGANEAIEVANATLDNPAAADWDDPSKCGAPPAEYTRISPVSDCVAFTINLQKGWVWIPLIDVGTTFGRVIGADAITTTAFAEAQGDIDERGGVLPYGIPNSSGEATEVCLKAGTGAFPTDVCDGPTTGNFGTLDIRLYGNETLNTPKSCASEGLSEQSRIAANSIIGVDHALDEYTHPALGSFEDPPETGEDIRNDVALCPIFNARPNEIEAQSGNNSGALHDGMYAGLTVNSQFRPGRLTDGPNPKVQLRNGPGVDDRPLWDYLIPGAGPPSCSPLVAPISDKAGMTQCLNDYVAGGYTDPIFSSTLADSPRLGFVPELWGEFPTGSSQPRTIKRFRAVFLETTYFQCNATECQIVHSPGEEPICNGVPGACPIGGNPKMNALTAFVFRGSMLPASIQEAFPGQPEDVTYALTR
ncbi:MAG: pilus assembly protein TadG-related protein [Acidimicrobiia bacterium]